MALTPIPATSAAYKFRKWVIEAHDSTLDAWDDFFEFGAKLAIGTTIGWRRMNATFTRTTPSGTTEDAAICTFDFLNMTAGVPDDTWTTGDFTAVESAADTMWTAIAGGLSPKLTLTSYRWYRKTFAPANSTYESGKPRYFNDSGPPVRVQTKSIVGTGGGTQQVPWQVSISVTEKTPLAAHWGRWYIPLPGMSNFDLFGRIASPSFFVTPAGVFYNACADADLHPVVPAGKARGLLSVTKLQVDDIPDVQRSRRARTTLVRATAL